MTGGHITGDLRKELDEYCRDSGLTITEVITRALRVYLHQMRILKAKS
jgi:hypothetical protein